MKININNGLINQPVTERKPVSVSSGPASTTKSGTVDRTTLSTSAPTVSNMIHTAMMAPSVRFDKVNSLRDAISSGNYKIDSTKIAGAITEDSSGS